MLLYFCVILYQLAMFHEVCLFSLDPTLMRVAWAASSGLTYSHERFLPRIGYFCDRRLSICFNIRNKVKRESSQKVTGSSSLRMIARANFA